ncbi:MAG: glycosyltransferase family 4 protein [Euryarchaeota archaeon]|nr:glycosyltransferase family 4 protein [Euryarchaeota archaeon]MDE1882183.1 glycosyltransferase family 4 protein [Euryarchaeota archaeon]
MGRVCMRYRQALESVGARVEVQKPEVRRGARVGAYLAPLLRQIRPRSYPREDGVFYHAVEPGIAIPGTTATTYHDLWEYNDRNLLNRLTFAGHLLSGVYTDRIVVLSESLRQGIRRHLGPTFFEKSVVVPLPFPDPGHSRRDTEYDLIWFGNNGPRKNLQLFLDALELVRDVSLRVSIRCQRHPRYPPVLSRPTHHRIDWVDRYVSEDELDALYRRSRTIVCTSLSEGMPAPLFEAYSRGTHVLTVPIPSVMDTFPPGTDGIHYSLATPQQLAKNILRSLSWGSFVPDPEFLAVHSFRSVGEGLLRVYKEARGGGSMAHPALSDVPTGFRGAPPRVRGA